MPAIKFLPTPLLALLVFILYGWMEFEAFFLVGEVLGGLLTFIGIFVTAFFGLWLLRRLFAFILADLQASLLSGRAGTGAVLDGVGLLAGAFLMLLPGYVTDFLGLLCFLPGIRRQVGQFLFSRFASGQMASFMASHMPGGHAKSNAYKPNPDTQASQRPAAKQVIDGDWQEKD